MKKHGTSLLVLVGMIALTFYVVFRNYSFHDVMTIAAGADTRMLLAAFGMVLIHMVFGGWALKVLMRSLHHRISLGSGTRYMAIEFYFSGITPSATGGQPAQAYYMAKDEVPVSKSTTALLLVTVLYKLVLVVLGGAVFLLRMPLILDQSIMIALLFALGVVINLIVIAVCWMAMFSQTMLRQIGYGVMGFLSRIKIWKPSRKRTDSFEHFLAGMKKSADHLRHHKEASLAAFVIIFFQRTALFSIGYLVYRSFGMEGAGYFDFMAIQVITAVAVDSLPLPGGVGASEAIFMKLYGPIYTSDMRASAMILSRGIGYYFYLLVSAVISILNHVYVIHKQNKLLS